MEWISVDDKNPPRGRDVLICDDLHWVFTGRHESNYLAVELPSHKIDYTKKGM